MPARSEPDYWRQLDIFAPSNFKKSITVIGAGATGSYIVWLLAKMGCKDITVYDFDMVEDHNLPNQVFGLADVGKKKVDALAKAVEAGTGIKIKAVSKKFLKGSLKGIVFVLTDTMESRKTIWESSVRYQLKVDLMIETRMEAEGGRIYAIKPAMPQHVAAYEKTLYTDAEAEESPCTRRAIAPTVATLAGMAVFTMINFANSKKFANEAIVSLSPLIVLSKNY
jgi:hypothetical protein